MLVGAVPSGGVSSLAKLPAYSTPHKPFHNIGLESSSIGFSLSADSSRPVPLRVGSLDSRQFRHGENLLYLFIRVANQDVSTLRLSACLDLSCLSEPACCSFYSLLWLRVLALQSAFFLCSRTGLPERGREWARFFKDLTQSFAHQHNGNFCNRMGHTQRYCVSISFHLAVCVVPLSSRPT